MSLPTALQSFTCGLGFHHSMVKESLPASLQSPTLGAAFNLRHKLLCDQQPSWRPWYLFRGELVLRDSGIAFYDFSCLCGDNVARAFAGRWSRYHAWVWAAAVGAPAADYWLRTCTGHRRLRHSAERLTTCSATAIELVPGVRATRRRVCPGAERPATHRTSGVPGSYWQSDARIGEAAVPGPPQSGLDDPDGEPLEEYEELGEAPCSTCNDRGPEPPGSIEDPEADRLGGIRSQRRQWVSRYAPAA